MTALNKDSPETHGDVDLAQVQHVLEAPPPKSRTLVALVVGGVAIFCVAFVVGVVPRLKRTQELSAELEAATAAPTVRVVKPVASAPTRSVTLPGTVQAWRETSLYARTSGYLRRWLVDIGDHVKEGQLLAEIETPELDQEIAQARATLAQQEAALAQSRASLELASTNAERYLKLAPTGVTSKQEVDEKSAGKRVAEANVQAAQASVEAVKANLARLSEVKGFARVVAPFSGIITTRTTEVGALVSAGTSAGAALFHLSQVDPVRVFITVPQSFAPSLTLGAKVPVRIREFRDQVFPGVVTRTAGALDESSRTLLTEVQVPNPEGTLLTGMYAQVTIDAATIHTPLRVPSSALVSATTGTQVGVVKGGVVHFVPVLIETDLGTEVTLASGLLGDEQVITNPSERLMEGLSVAIQEVKVSAPGEKAKP